MKKQLVAVGIIIKLFTVVFSGCLNYIKDNYIDIEKSKFVGKWKFVI